MSQTATWVQEDILRDDSLLGDPAPVPAARPARGAILALLRSQLCPALRG
jgi:hypothetical protein